VGSNLYPPHWEGLVYVLHSAIRATETEVRIQPAVIVEIQDLTLPCRKSRPDPIWALAHRMS
jgi:hypothetical protein